ncbi:MAG TPA: SxtJ family membrane protein [Anaerohalosphaeraceae bacterium]|nr:hypothetical protein [Phycisphaerae bacterium]HOK95265.1 SxtJ family membrane protein [Anaerohalosphaeraceae bacterium]HOL31259.1 SxtJ family membrane protein [Anaerohalosphaeraceae bacterium]HOM76062.1 SxtJ family membrane protein [Anaerohalosphaeraceae bacterium]HPC64263.1 SxtJ family membrane protein [Anaerohalosphaeraceae bacterium]
MTLIKPPLNPSDKELRTFGFACLTAAAAASLILFKTARATGVQCLFIFFLGAAVCGLGLIRPLWAKPVYRVMILLGFPIGWLLSHMILAFFFYCIFTPVGLCRRLLGNHPLRRYDESRLETYWIPRPKKPTAKDYFRQF